MKKFSLRLRNIRSNFRRKIVAGVLAFFAFSYLDNFTSVLTDPMNLHIVEALGDLNYRSPFTLPTCIQQMIYDGFILKDNANYCREFLRLSDDSQVALDWLNKPLIDKPRKLIVILHGLTGGSESCYIQNIANTYSKDTSTRVVCINYPGINSNPLKTSKSFHPGYTNYLKETLDHFKETYKDEKIFLIGASMGANIMANFLAESEAHSKNYNIRAFVSVSNPFHIEEVEKINRWGLIDFYLLDRMKSYVKEHLQVVSKDSKLNLDKMLKARTYREFDSEYTCKVFGFSDVDEYYRKVGSFDKLALINVPSLFLNARNDKLSPIYKINLNVCKGFNCSH